MVTDPLTTVHVMVIAEITSFSWRNSPLVGLGLLLVYEDFCGF